jgi:DNA modification methylase
MKRNALNDLSPKDWIKFQKSWFIHNPPRREPHVLLHPAKFPESLVEEFISFFTKKGMNVLDPMVGTGSTLLACVRTGRHGYGIELNAAYARIARERVKRELALLEPTGDTPRGLTARVVTGDARNLRSFKLPTMDYCITSPPYWDMLRMKGAFTQKTRRTEGLDVAYSENAADLGNIADYAQFLNDLVAIYREVHGLLRPRAYLTVIVKNVKKKGKIYPLAWDLGRELGRFFVMKDEKIWCQDNQRLAPYGLGNAWVSNTHHHYCLNLRKES